MSTTPEQRRTPLLRLTLLAAATALAAGCTTRAVDTGGSAEMAAMGPILSVERFLQAANARDFEAMAGLFGTYDGPFKSDRRELELQMATIAEILRHRDYEIVSERREAGRSHPTNRIGVDIRKNRDELVRDVPFLVVRSRDGHWLIEEIGLEKVTSN